LVVKPGREETVFLKMKILVTTVLTMELSVKTWKDEESQFKESRLLFTTRSQLSTKLDPDDLNVDELLKKEPIGRGSFGDVYKGEYSGREVAIKILKKPKKTSAMFFEKLFRNEVFTMEKLRHNAIVSFIGAVDFPGRFMIVTEFCKYGNLYKAMKGTLKNSTSP